MRFAMVFLLLLSIVGGSSALAARRKRPWPDKGAAVVLPSVPLPIQG